MAVANLPPHGTLPSQKNKETEPKKKVESVVKGEAKLKKKSLAEKFADAFITDDLASVKNHVVTEVIVPGIINSILDAVNDGLSMIFKVNPRRSGGSVNGGYVNYAKSSSNYKYGSSSNNRNDSSDHNPRPGYYSVTIATQSDANEVISSMQDLAQEYRWASVADYYDLAGVSVDKQEWTYNKYGWNFDMLKNVRPRRDREGWYLDLPKPVVID